MHVSDSFFRCRCSAQNPDIVAPASGLASGLAALCQTLAVCTGQTRETIRAVQATHKVVDFERVEVISVVDGKITLRLTTLEEEENLSV